MLESDEFVLLCEESRNVNSKVIGLPSRITKIDTVKSISQLLAKSLRIFSLPFIEVDLRNMLQFTNLLGGHLCDGRMGMPHRNGGNASNEIDVSVSFVIVEILHVSLRHKEGILVIVEVEVGHVGLSIFDNGLIGWSLVGGRGVVYWREMVFATAEAESWDNCFKHKIYSNLI